MKSKEAQHGSTSPSTPRPRAGQAARPSEERLALAAQSPDDAPWNLDVGQDRVCCAPQWWRMLGYAVDELAADSTLWRGLAHPDDLARVERIWDDALRGGRESFSCEMRLRHRDGRYVPILSRGFVSRAKSGKAVRVSGADVDLTELQSADHPGQSAEVSRVKASDDPLEFLAHGDPLTALPNRSLLFHRLEHAINLGRRENRRFALLRLELDRFDAVVEGFGHWAGDELLRLVADRLRSRLRAVDMASRLGGGEFAVLLENLADHKDAAQVAGELAAALGEPWRLSNGAEVSIGASVGISLFPGYGQTAEELSLQAEAALHRARRAGSGNCRCFSED